MKIAKKQKIQLAKTFFDHFLRPCSEVMARELGISTAADTLADCSIDGMHCSVEFLRKWSEHLRGDAF